MPLGFVSSCSERTNTIRLNALYASTASEEASEETPPEVETPTTGTVEYITWGPTTLVHTGPFQRQVLLTGGIDAHVANAICSQLTELDELDGQAPIIMRINTPGGEVPQAMAIYDTMRSITAPVLTLVHGIAYSAGLFLLQGGDLRLMFPNSLLHYHAPGAVFEGNAPQLIADNSRLYNLFHHQLAETIRKRSKITKRVWRREFESKEIGRTFTAEEAADLGLVDHVIEHHNKKSFTLE